MNSSARRGVAKHDRPRRWPPAQRHVWPARRTKESCVGLCVDWGLEDFSCR